MKNDMKAQYAIRVGWQEAAAMKKYHERYDNAVFNAAAGNGINSKPGRIIRANKLLDDAMTLCGSPWYKLSHIRWNEKELAFLMLFT